MAQARQLLYPSEDEQKLVYLATSISGTPHRAASSQLFTEDRRLWGPVTCLETLNHQAACSLLPHLTRNGDFSRCGALSLKPQCCLLWVCVVGQRVEEEGGKAMSGHCCLTQKWNPIPKHR